MAITAYHLCRVVDISAVREHLVEKGDDRPAFAHYGVEPVARCCDIRATQGKLYVGPSQSAGFGGHDTFVICDCVRELAHSTGESFPRAGAGVLQGEVSDATVPPVL